jgi:transcriptional regulator with XRE-family HTH domain
LKTNNLVLRPGLNKDTFALMVPIEHLGRALATLREKHGRTQEDVAGAAGVTASMISNYERGKEKPSLDSLWKILGAMNCSLIDLEASLRFVRGDAFPLHCQNWRISIEADDYDLASPPNHPSEIAEPSFNLPTLLKGHSPIADEAEHHLNGMIRAMVGMVRLAEYREKPE